MHQFPSTIGRRTGAGLAVLLGLLTAATAFANPAMNFTRTTSQPDGTPLELRLWGDEFANGWETTDGYTVRFDAATGYWVYAVLGEDGGLVESTARAGIDAPNAAPHLRPQESWLEPRYRLLGDNPAPRSIADKAAPPWASGSTNVLIIMVQFPADPADPDGAQPAVSASFTAAQADANFFGGTATGPGNMTDYFDEVSYGALNLVGTVVGPYTLAHDKNDYDDGPLGARDMVAEAIALADGDIDYNDFDNDGDGWVDNVAVMYAGNGPDNGGYQGADPDVNNLWPHASSLGAPVAVDGINAQTYYIAPELLSAAPRLRTIGVYAHEFGHKLGLPDLYDTDDAPDDSDGIGHWCLMASGSWCSNNPGSENGEAPSHMSAWCKSVLGWVSPTDLTGAATAAAIPTAATNAYAAQLGTNPGGPDDWPGGSGEYFLVENRQRVGFDIGLDGCGLLVWHIDESLNHNRDQGHTAGAHRLVDLEEADGLNDLDSSGTRGDAGDPFPGATANTLWDDDTNPHARLYDGTATGFRMAVLSDACAATMTATFGNQAPIAQCQDVQVDADGDCQGAVTAAMVDDGSSDPDGDPITLSLDPPGPYPLGVTPVTLTVTDDKGESDTCTANVTVVDVTPPVVACPADIEVECSVAGGVPADDAQLAAFFAGFTAEDNCDDTPDVVHDAPALLPGPCGPGGGVTVVTWTATDGAGNAAQCSATVTVVDTTPPELAVTVAPPALWPPNHKLVDVEFTVTMADVCDADAAWELVGVTSNEPDNGLGDGDTAGDIQGADAGTADTIVSLRSERGGLGDGRVYTATFMASDCAGNSTFASVDVHVPHSRSELGTILAAGGSHQDLGNEVTYMVSGASLWPKLTPVEELDGGLRTIAPRAAVIGNTAGFVASGAFFLEDVDDDRLEDVLLAFDRRELVDLARASAVEDGDPVLMLEMGNGSFRILELTEVRSVDLDLGGIISTLRAGAGDGDGGDELALDRERSTDSPPRVRATGLVGAAPNPFNPSTTISFHLAEPARTELAVYDLGGRLVARLVSGHLDAGDHAVRWHGTDDRGGRVSSGVYFTRLTAGAVVDTRRMTLLK
ncbi:MAG: M6 family metalloprotease domain-containing protein [Candidatus Krumholzibacteriia bacterium]